MLNVMLCMLNVILCMFLQVYKFKNDIKLRFTGSTPGEKIPESSEMSDQGSNSSREDDLIRAKSIGGPHHAGGKSSSDYSNRSNVAMASSISEYHGDREWSVAPTDGSSNHSNGGASQQVKVDLGAGTPERKLYCVEAEQHGAASSVSADIKDERGGDEDEEEEGGGKSMVPAFALHPMGTFYVPLVIRMTQLLPYLHSNNSMQLCHPISIPVNFSRPAATKHGSHHNNFKVNVDHLTANTCQRMECS